MNATVIPSETWPAGTKITLARLRLTAKPTVSIEGLIGDDDISANTVSLTKLKTQPLWYAVGTVVTNVCTVTLTNAPASLADGLAFRFKPDANLTTGATLNLNALGAKKVLRADGSALVAGDVPSTAISTVVYNSTADTGSGAWILQGSQAAGAGGGAYVASTTTLVGVEFQLTFPTDQAPASNADGTTLRWKVPSLNPAAATLKAGSLAAAPLVDPSGNTLKGGELPAGRWVESIFDGTNWQIVGDAAVPPYGLDTGSAANVYVISVPGLPNTITTGTTVWLNPTHANTGASTLTVNGGTATIKRWFSAGAADLTEGDLLVGELVQLVYDGTYWRMVQRRRTFAYETAVPTSVGSACNFAHGLGGAPDRMECWLRCTTADRGYAIGDKVNVLRTCNSSWYPYPLAPFCNATVVGVVVANADAICVHPKGGGSGATITNGSWVLEFSAERYA
jgi:hypothetical protein